jgi:hypothetical protein
VRSPLLGTFLMTEIQTIELPHRKPVITFTCCTSGFGDEFRDGYFLTVLIAVKML